MVTMRTVLNVFTFLLLLVGLVYLVEQAVDSENGRNCMPDYKQSDSMTVVCQ